MIARYSFVALTAADLAAARAFWVDVLECPVTEEQQGHYFIIDAGGLRLCVDSADGEIHRLGGSDPVIGLHVEDLARTLAVLAMRRVHPEKGPITSRRGHWALIRDPQGRAVILTEGD